MLGNNQANIKAVITADDRASKTLQNFGNGVSKTAKRVGIALTAAGGAAVALGVKSVKAYEESENALAQLNAVLKSTKGVAGVTAKAATNLASALQKVTKYSDEDVLSAENLLLTFTKIGKDIFPDATKIVLDMSTALGQDLSSSAIQLGKALQDPILGVTALRRVGVNFDASAKETIKRLVETGQSAKAQALIMKELKTEFGGAAEAAGNTFAGRLAILRNSLGEVQEKIGSVIVNAITPFAQRLAEFVASDKFQAWIQKINKWLSVNIPIAMNYVSTVIIPLLASAFNTVWPVIRTLLKWLASLTKFLSDNMWLVQSFAAYWITVKSALLMAGVAGAFRATMKVVRGEIITTAATAAAATGPGSGIAKLLFLIGSRASLIGTVAALGVAAYKLSQSGTPAKPGPAGPGGRAAPSKLQTNLGFASGTDYAPGGQAIVGERGPEVVNLPRGSQVIPNHRLGGSVNLSVNIGIYAGSEIEKRKVAKELFNAYNELMRSRGMA